MKVQTCEDIRSKPSSSLADELSCGCIVDYSHKENAPESFHKKCTVLINDALPMSSVGKPQTAALMGSARRERELSQSLQQNSENMARQDIGEKYC